ncbi:hypothetical protein [Cellulomonas sp. Leaf395]|uniref:hypothetical protein n=1 Tax=Cellulomonas sp. Leaf395 TaxID=1736362 RepID=UPI0006FD73D4|nr:hypothetical protein [Cellulomonas sp. Leaf395]KQT01326.1 hypothetical protein ASG23_07110 [Cellulomonas sp. Leaf395]
MHARTLAAAVITAALVLLPTAAHAGSDSPTPYTVAADGLTLPSGTTFEADGHINYRVTAPDGTGAQTFNVHQAVPHNGIWPEAAYVGKSYYPWTAHPQFAAAFPEGYCVAWVQVSLYDEHFGEGGQRPVCTDGGTPAGSTDSGELEGATDTTETITAPDSTDVSGPTVPGSPVEPASPDTQVLAADSSFRSEVLADSTGQLASTGVATGPLVMAGLAALVAGTALLVMVRRRDDQETAS